MGERKTLVIGVDVDGVLANFNKAYRERLGQITGRWLIPEGEEPPCWNYATEHYGYTKEEDGKTWESIIADHRFWFDLDSLPNANDLIDTLNIEMVMGNEVYFITTRPGRVVRSQTTGWLCEAGVQDPHVLIARGEKGLLASGLKLTHFIDDRPENCLSVRVANPSCAVFLLAARYNQYFHEEARQSEITVINNVNEFCAVLEEAGSCPASKAS